MPEGNDGGDNNDSTEGKETDSRIQADEEAAMQSKLKLQLDAIETKSVRQDNDNLRQQIKELEKSLGDKLDLEKEALLKDVPEPLRKLAKKESVDFIRGLLVSQNAKQGLPLTPKTQVKPPDLVKDKGEGRYNKETGRWNPKRTVKS